MIEQAIAQAVEEIAASAPASWASTVVVGTAATDSLRISRSYATAGEVSIAHRGRRSNDKLSLLAQQVRAIRDWMTVSLELRCNSRGEYRFTAFSDIVSPWRGSGNGFTAILDGKYRPSQPGDDLTLRPVHPVVDPDLTVARFGDYMRLRAAVLGGPESLPLPASDEALDEAERQIGFPLPPDLRSLYLIANGDSRGSQHRYLFDNYAWLPVERLAPLHAELGKRPWFGWDLEWDEVVIDAVPADTVRRCRSHSRWLPFASGEDGNYLAVDLAPAAEGRSAQLIRIGRDYNNGPQYVSSSIESLIEHQSRLLRDGTYDIEDGLILFRRHAAPEDSRMIVNSFAPGLRIPENTQWIQISDAVGPVDLTALAGLSRLRRLWLNNCYTTDLSPIRALPVESLSIEIRGSDLSPLQNHRHLGSLELRTSAATDSAPLAKIPNLQGLDLSHADIADISNIAGLNTLRFLALDIEQWGALLESGYSPKLLAAARLTDANVAFDKALAWAAQLGVNTEGALMIDGTV